MSNNNAFWGKRFGYRHKDDTNALVISQMGHGKERAGNKKPTPPLNAPVMIEATKQKKLYERTGMPVYHYDGYTGKRLDQKASNASPPAPRRARSRPNRRFANLDRHAHQRRVEANLRRARIDAIKLLDTAEANP